MVMINMADTLCDSNCKGSHMSPEPSAVPVMLTADDRHWCQV